MVRLEQISINELLVDLYWQTHYGNKSAMKPIKLLKSII